jgi:FHA domain
MADCTICGEKIPEGSRTCSICGSSADEFMPTATWLNAAPAAAPPMELPPGGRYCPVCGKIYGSEHTDGFCTCGTELRTEEVPMAPVLDDLPMAPVLDDLPMAPILDEEPIADPDAVKVRSVKPSPGTPCLVLYGPDKQPLQYFALTKDAMLIGRLDAVTGNFPDIDLDEWFDRATIRRISRQHALILRTRATSTFVLRPLVGNTGTQLEAQMVQPQQDYPLKPGQRIILGGVIRLKFEVA